MKQRDNEILCSRGFKNMLELSVEHIIGIVITLAGITLVGIYSGKKVKNASDFSTGGRNAGYALVAGTILGTACGGASTIGTAQLAFDYGISAWWFTIGAAIGCLILGLIFAKPLCQTKSDTIPEILAEEYGGISGPVSSVFVSMGMFLNIVAQVLSAVALLTSMFNINPSIAAIISTTLMACYVVFGGVWGTGLVGIVKLILIYLSVTIAGVLAFTVGGGTLGFKAALPAFPYFHIFGRGIMTDVFGSFSVALGMLSTQIYIQAVISGKTVRESKIATLISAFLILPIGLGSVLVGMYMKSNYPHMDSALAFPVFVLKVLNPWIGGIVLATLLIAVVGTGAGLALGIGTIFSKDIYKTYINKKANDGQQLMITRIIILVILGITLIFAGSNIKSLILKWSFMSMGLRGATAFVPLCAALFLKGKVRSNMVICAMIFGPLTVLFGEILFPDFIDPLFSGLVVSVLFITVGLLLKTKEEDTSIGGQL